jgi:hypothetical protein
MTRVLCAFTILLTVTTFVGCSPAEEPAPEPAAEPAAAPPAAEPEATWAYFEVGFPTLAEGRFVIALDDPDTIKQAREAIAAPDKNPSSIMGILSKETAPYNPPWSYHLKSSTIELFDNAIEVCDATPEYVEEHLEEACGAFLPNCEWCPWESKVVAEIADPSQADETGAGESE